MSRFYDAIWGDDLTEDDVAEWLEMETQASQAPGPSSIQDAPSIARRNSAGKLGESLQRQRIPSIIQQLRDTHNITLGNPSTSSTSTSSSSSSPSFVASALSLSQRKLKTPIRSLPEMSQSQMKEKNLLATTEWLRKELEKHKKLETELKENKQTLEGEVRLLRERNNTYQQQLLKTMEQAEENFKQKEEKYLGQIKGLEKEAESARIQLALKAKESEANKERYLELKKISVLEPEYPQTDLTPKQRNKNLGQASMKADCTRMLDVSKRMNVDDDDDEDDYYNSVTTKKLKRDTQSDLKNFTCDQLIRVMDGPAIVSPTKQAREPPVAKMDINHPCASSIESLPVISLKKTEDITAVKKTEVLEDNVLDLAVKLPWLKDSGYSMSFHLGRLLHEEIAETIYTLSDPEIKIVVPPCIDYDPGNVLKMDFSDLQYLEITEKGKKIWGVNLNNKFDSSNGCEEGPSDVVDKDTGALETVKTILGSQMCCQSPDQSRLNESLVETCSPHQDLSKSSAKSNETSVGSEDSVLVRSLEPVHVHLKALTKLANWDSSMDLVCPIVEHLTQMVNDLYERVCDPRIPDQLKDQFYNNEFATGKLFMEGPYTSNNLLTHKKWTERERYVEVRRGLAVMSVLCSLNRDIADLILDSQLLHDASRNSKTTIKQSTRNYGEDLLVSASLRNQANKKIICKVNELSLQVSALLKEEESEIPIWRKQNQLSDRNSADSAASLSGLISTPASSNSALSDPKFNDPLNFGLSNAEALDLLKSVDSSSKQEDGKNQSSEKNPSPMQEVLDSGSKEYSEGDSAQIATSRSMDKIYNDSYKAWFDAYTKNKLNFTVEESQTSKSQKFNSLLDAQLAEKERKELGVYLKRRKVFKEFYQAVTENGGIWSPELDKMAEGGFQSDLEGVKNLYDYENKISTMNSTILSSELASMKPGPFCPINTSSAVYSDITIRSQEESPVDNEWRVNSLQKNEEDPNLTKVEEPAQPEIEKNWSFFEKFKTTNSETTKDAVNTESLAVMAMDSKNKGGTSKSRKHSLAPLKKKSGRDISPPESLTDINKEMEMEVELLFGKGESSKKMAKLSLLKNQSVDEMTPFSPDLWFPENYSDDDQSLENLSEFLSTVPSMEDDNFESTFKEAYSRCETVASKFGHKIKPYKRLMVASFIEAKKRTAQDEAKKKHEVPRKERKRLNQVKEIGRLMEGTCSKNEDESDAIISMLNQEALKYNLNKNINLFEKKRGKLDLLEGLLEIVSAINYCRLTLVFYPLLSSCVSLMESLFKQSFNNLLFNTNSFVLIMKVLNEVTCCQPPPDILKKVLAVLLYAVNYPDIVECLCKKRSNLVSLVTNTEFCFFKGVCMMQPLCYLVGVLSGTKYPGYWVLCLAFTSWLRQLYEKYRSHLELWYPPNQVCNCIPVLHSALFTTLSKASAFLANHGVDLEEDVRCTVSGVVEDGIRLCEMLIDMDTNFINHLDRFNLYNEFLVTVKEMHYDPHFSPFFHLQPHQLNVVECLINANELIASKSKGGDSSKREQGYFEQTKLNFNRVFDAQHIFLNCADKYDLLC